jgi:alpha-ketoglutarate-dependent taurine dioxygenase
LKLIQPKEEVPANTGDTIKDLGPHVDGTQHPKQPVSLIFQYIADAKIGAQSLFYDMAKVLLDIPGARRNQLLFNLARPDAATFSKNGMEYVGPIFSVTNMNTVRCRIRFDDVIKVHPDCQDDFNYLAKMLGKDKYRVMFKPIEGDIVIFDNWRLLHARDEVFGRRARQHNRMWICDLRRNLLSMYQLGIRGLPVEIIAEIKRRNSSNGK